MYVQYGIECGYNVIYNIRDFLDRDVTYELDYVITNPPFSIKDDVIERCLEYGKPSMLVLPMDSLGGVKRHSLFKSFKSFPKVYCPCDNFSILGIVSIESLDIDGNYFKYDGNSKIITKYNIGGYDSSVSDKIKQNCDIIVTNPPFSNYRLFYEWVFDKKYIIICPIVVLHKGWCFDRGWTTGYTGRLNGEYSKYIYHLVVSWLVLLHVI